MGAGSSTRAARHRLLGLRWEACASSAAKAICTSLIVALARADSHEPVGSPGFAEAVWFDATLIKSEAGTVPVSVEP